MTAIDMASNRHHTMERAAAAVPLPSSLRGKRCLDVGTRDGFWALEMERRHAASVVATGADASFDRALESAVELRDVDVTDLSPETVGEFDVVFCGALATRVRDPVAALAAVRTVCRELLVLEDAIDVTMSRVRRATPTAVLDGRGSWWTLNPAGLARVAESAGFDIVTGPVRFVSGSGARAALLARPI